MTKATKQATQENIHTLNLTHSDWQMLFGMFCDTEEKLKKDLVNYSHLEMERSVTRTQQEFLELQLLFAKVTEQAHKSDKDNA